MSKQNQRGSWMKLQHHDRGDIAGVVNSRHDFPNELGMAFSRITWSKKKRNHRGTNVSGDRSIASSQISPESTAPLNPDVDMNSSLRTHIMGQEASMGVTVTTGLQSSKTQRDVLNMIDKLRFEGLDRDISLPQLVVCGDQSSGKSSVLEAIAEIPFPRKENLCTRFATEIILRRKKFPSITCKIIPDKARTPEEQNLLASRNFTIRDTSELPAIIEQATKLMGLEETIEGKGAFSKDILSIEVEGPEQPHLTLVDLPGLIHSENKLQTTADVETIGKLVEKYISNRRTIILPVISAKNDYANQIILKKAREADPDGRRTLGIITKPDDLYPGSENENAFINLAKNEDISFSLGWHALRNRNAQEMNLTFLERERKERLFFATSGWSQLSDENLGISSLRKKLSDLLYNHIKQELPTLRKELDAIYAKTEARLLKLGENRSSVQQQRQYLTRLSIQFHDLTRSATTGLYGDSYFNSSPLQGLASTENQNRLCALVASYGLEFAEVMNKHGHKFGFNQRSPTGMKRSVKLGREDVIVNQVSLNPNESLALVKRMLASSRGTELPGSFNPRLIAELYQTQSQNWATLAAHHVAHIAEICESFCNILTNHLAPAGRTPFLDQTIEKALDARLCAAKAELTKILDDEKYPPLTFNHYYTLTIQKSRAIKRKRSTEELAFLAHINGDKRPKTTSSAAAPFGMPGGAMWSFGGSKASDGAASSHPPTPDSTIGIENDTGDIIFEDGESDATDTRTILMDMDAHSSRDALEALQSYYKVARKTFIDNIEKQVIRRHLINGLENIFSPAVIASWNDEEISLAAAESRATMLQRADLEGRLTRLKNGIEIFKRAERMGA